MENIASGKPGGVTVLGVGPQLPVSQETTENGRSHLGDSHLKRKGKAWPGGV